MSFYTVGCSSVRYTRYVHTYARRRRRHVCRYLILYKCITFECSKYWLLRLEAIVSAVSLKAGIKCWKCGDASIYAILRLYGLLQLQRILASIDLPLRCRSQSLLFLWYSRLLSLMACLSRTPSSILALQLCQTQRRVIDS